MRTKTRSAAQLAQTQKSREAVRDFLRPFHAREMWTMDGPMMTEVDEIMCFNLWEPVITLGEGYRPMGICIVQTWLGGGWAILTEPTSSGELDETAKAIVRNRVSKQMLAALLAALPEIDEELSQRKTCGNGEMWHELQKLSDQIATAIKAARGEPVLEHNEGTPDVT